MATRHVTSRATCIGLADGPADEATRHPRPRGPWQTSCAVDQATGKSPEGWRQARIGCFAERIRSRLIVSAEAKMSDHQREIYHSENGDRWLLCRDDDGRVFVLHKANLSSGGTATKIELRDFLGKGKAGPEHQALARLIGTLVDND
jgi:hypothetical protein